MKHWWLYALKLEQGKYYVGITSQKNPENRIKQHKSGFAGAMWTRHYKPLETLEMKDLGVVSEEEAKNAEHEMTLDYIDRFGLENVRGADIARDEPYIQRFNRYFTMENWGAATVIIFLMLVILVLLIW